MLPTKLAEPLLERHDFARLRWSRDCWSSWMAGRVL
jgi:hypothetical protein